MDEVDRPQVTAEAKFIRGAAYFALVQIFGKDWNNGDPTVNDGVPLILKSTIDVDATSAVPRNKVAEVYTQILDDLTAAEADLPVTNNFYANQIAADAILASDDGILCATTAFGKTVIAAWLIAARKVNTLVLVHRRHRAGRARCYA